MNISKELIEKAKTAKTAEELLQMAKAEHIELTEEEAVNAFAELNKSGELSDEELDNVAGGCGEPDYKYYVGDNVLIYGMKFSYRIVSRYRSFPANIIFYNCANSYFPEDVILVRESSIECRGQRTISEGLREELRSKGVK